MADASPIESPAKESPTVDVKSSNVKTSQSADNIQQQPIDEAVEASESGEDAFGGSVFGGWGSWITAAKSKSAEVLGMVKKDLDELSTAVKSEASHVINSTSSAFGKTFKLDEPDSTANTMKKSLSSFLDQVNTVLNPSPDDEDTEIILEVNGDYVTLPTYQRDLLALQKLDATYLLAPEGPALASMAAWLEATSRPSVATLEKHLRASSVLKEKLERLVPHAVGRDEFWERYLFRKALLEDKLAQLNRNLPTLCTDAIVNSISPSADECPAATTTTPVDSPTHSTNSSGDSARSNYGSSKSRSMDFEPSSAKDNDKIGDYIDDVVWENEDFAANIELTEEQQIKLLQEYENEINASDKQRRLFEDGIEPDLSEGSSAPTSKSSHSPTSSKSTSSSPKKKAETNVKNVKAKATSKETVSSNKTKTDQATKKSASKNQSNTKKKSSDVSNLVEDHFVVDNNKKSDKKNRVKSLSEEMAEKNDDRVLSDNASNNSDGSWEKEFEMDDLRINPK